MKINFVVLKQQKMMVINWNVNIFVKKFFNAVINAKNFVCKIALKCMIQI